MKNCPRCGTPYKSLQSAFCTNCGTKRPNPEGNTCTNPSCANYDRPVGGEDRYCELCGSLTTFGQMLNGMT